MNDEIKTDDATEKNDTKAPLVERLVSCLKNEYTLVNRGTGWYLAPKYIPYKSQPSELIPDEVVEMMEKNGIIETVVPYNSAKAILCN